MSKPRSRPPGWLMIVFFVSSLGLLVIPACPRMPWMGGAACAAMGAFLLVAVVAVVAGRPVAQLAASIVRALVARKPRG